MTKDRWENTVWDTDIYLDDIDDWGVCKDCAIKDNCAEYKPNKRQCEDYERHKEVLTNEEWLKSMTTEELAEFLHDIKSCCSTCTLTAFKHYKSGIMKCPLNVACAKENGIAEWLKQPHKKE